MFLSMFSFLYISWLQDFAKDTCSCITVLYSNRLADLRSFMLRQNDISSLLIVKERQYFTNADLYLKIFELFVKSYSITQFPLSSCQVKKGITK